MTTNSNQGPQSDPVESYGGYGGYQPANPVDDPYGASQRGGFQQSSDPTYVYGQHQQASSDQQQTYEPPESVLRGRKRKSSEASTSSTAAASQGPIEKEDRRFALYSYLGFCFTGIVFFFLKSKRPFIRFHAAQSVVLFVPIVAILLVLQIVSIITLIPFIGWIFIPVIGLLKFVVIVPAFILWVLLMVLSYQGVRVKLPIVGHYAEALVARFSANK
jgi:uncharacterized membrane protein